MKEVNLDIKTVKVESKVRKLRSSITSEMVSDLIITNSFDMEKFEKEVLSGIKRQRIKNKISSIFEHDKQR